MALNGIALRIFGGSQAGGLNQTPLVSVGSLSELFVPMPPTLVNEEQCWMITHTCDYTVYALHTKAYKTHEGQPGQLLICLLLPPSQRINKDKDPLTLLNTVRDYFVKVVKDDMLPNAPIDSSSFDDLLKQYTLTERTRPLPVMAGSKPAAFQPKNQAQLFALMLYSNYPVLATVSRLEIGMDCHSTIDIPMGGNHKPKEKPYRDGGKKKKRLKAIVGTAVAVVFLALLWGIMHFRGSSPQPSPAEGELTEIEAILEESKIKEDEEEAMTKAEDEARLIEVKKKAAEEAKKEAAEEAPKKAAEEAKKKAAEEAKKKAAEEAKKKAEEAKKKAAEEAKKKEETPAQNMSEKEAVKYYLGSNKDKRTQARKVLGSKVNDIEFMVRARDAKSTTPAIKTKIKKVITKLQNGETTVSQAKAEVNKILGGQSYEGF